MTDAELAILSIIAEAPIVGVDIQDVIAARNLRLWTLIGVESVYYVIEKLERQGLITNIDEHPPEDTRLRLYRATPAGIGVLQTAVMDLLSTPRQLPHSFDMGLANLPVLKTSQVRHALRSYRADLQTRHDALIQKRDQVSAGDAPFHILSMFDHQIALLEAELAWFDEWIVAWEAQPQPPEEAPAPLEAAELPRMQQLILPQDPDSFHKKPTRHHKKEEVEFPPPPQKREPAPESHSAETRVSSPTPPHIPKEQEQDDNE